MNSNLVINTESLARTSRKALLLAGVLAIFPSPSWAQDAPDGAAAEAGAAADASTVDSAEIVVTALKRGPLLQEPPLAISAVPGQETGEPPGRERGGQYV